MKTAKTIKARLEYLRGELRAERISQGELCELTSLASHIAKGDVELLEVAGVPEFLESRLDSHGSAEPKPDKATKLSSRYLDATEPADSELRRLQAETDASNIHCGTDKLQKALANLAAIRAQKVEGGK